MTDAHLADIVAALQDETHGRTARGIAATIHRMVSAQQLPEGSRLPTVRALAAAVGVSPTTVSEAWQALVAAGAIAPRGRLGTFVLDPAHAGGGPARYRRLAAGAHGAALDLSSGTPDPDLLPDLGRALASLGRAPLTTSYLDPPLLPELEAVLRDTFPFPSGQLTVVDGAMDALDRVTETIVRRGDRVAVEDPGFPPLLDLLELLGAEPIGLALDDEGVVPASLKAALARDPSAVYLQPRAQNPTGASTSARRGRALAELLGPVRAVVVEDDHAGDISASPLVSLGTHLPERTVHIRSFSKSHGPDLRLAAVGGPAAIVTAVANRRLLGPGWSSRLLQHVLAVMLCDPTTVAAVARARATYAERRAAVMAALDVRGVRHGGGDGINLWVEVADEQAALLSLAVRGVSVAPGAAFAVGRNPAPRVRVTVGLVRDGVDALADALAHAAQGPRRWGRGA